MSKRLLYNCLKEVIDKIHSLECPDDKFTVHGLFNDQFERETDEDPVTYPAVYLEFNSIEWTHLVGSLSGVSEGLATVFLHVGFKVLDKDNEYILDEVDHLYNKIKGLTTSSFSPLIRINETQDINYDNVAVWTIELTTKLTDATGLEEDNPTAVLQSVSIRPNITLSADC